MKIKEKLNDLSYEMEVSAGQYLCDYDSMNYFDDAIMNLAQDHVDIYTSDLMDWLQDHIYEFELYVSTQGIVKNFDLLDTIRGCQFEENYKTMIQKDKEIICEYYVLHELLYIHEIEEINEDIIDLHNFKYINRIDELKDIIDEILEEIETEEGENND